MVFYGLYLSFEELLKAKGDGVPKVQMHDILTSVTAQLDELFAQNLHTLTGRDRKEALVMMQWVLFSEEPLGWRQLHCVLYPDADPSHSLKQSSHVLAEYEGAEKLIRRRSRGLLELKTLSGESYFISHCKIRI